VKDVPTQLEHACIVTGDGAVLLRLASLQEQLAVDGALFEQPHNDASLRNSSAPSTTTKMP